MLDRLGCIGTHGRVEDGAELGALKQLTRGPQPHRDVHERGWVSELCCAPRHAGIALHACEEGVGLGGGHATRGGV